jgi:two-component system, NarL family, nitrate/nitrite response regulator NarL
MNDTVSIAASALVVDDHPLYRGALATLLCTLCGEATAREAASAEAGLELGASMQALRLVLLDFRLPGLNGAEAIRVFRHRFPGAAIVVISGSEDRREAEAALRAGARAFVHKSASLDQIAQVLRQVLDGHDALQPDDLADSAAAIGHTAPALTHRQLEILALLCRGESNKEIALRLGIALVTVKLHVSAIFRALGVVNRTQAAIAARRMGLPADL